MDLRGVPIPSCPDLIRASMPLPLSEGEAIGMDRRVKPGDDEKRRLLADIKRYPLLAVGEHDSDALGLLGKVEDERAEAHLALLPAFGLVSLGALVGRLGGAKDAEDVVPFDDAPPDLEILRGRVAAAVVGGGIFAEK